jgi:prefoldin subunit 5
VQELKGLAKKTEMLDGEVRGLQQQKLELEKERDRVTFLKDSIQKQHGALKSELGQSPGLYYFTLLTINNS